MFNSTLYYVHSVPATFFGHNFGLSQGSDLHTIYNKLFEPVHKYKRLIFKMCGLQYTLKCKIQITFSDKFIVVIRQGVNMQVQQHRHCPVRKPSVLLHTFVGSNTMSNFVTCFHDRLLAQGGRPPLVGCPPLLIPYSHSYPSCRGDSDPPNTVQFSSTPSTRVRFLLFFFKRLTS